VRESPLIGGGAAPPGEKPRLPLVSDGRREEGEVRDDRHGLGPEGDVRSIYEILEVGGCRAQMERPRRGFVLARREHAALDSVAALPKALQAFAREAVVRRGMHLALVDDARTGLGVVLDALPGEPVIAVVEDHSPRRHGITGLAVDLDPVGEKARSASGRLDVAARDEQVVGADLLEAVHHDRDIAAMSLDAVVAMSPGELWGGRGGDGCEQQEENRSPNPPRGDAFE